MIGGFNLIHHNVFENARSTAGQSVLRYAPNIYHYMPDSYFEYAHASMVYIKYTEPPFDLPVTNTLKAEFYANTLRNNKHIQIVGIGHTYRGSLVNVECEIPQAFFSFSQNLVEDNLFLGKDTRLIEIHGPIMNVERNVLMNNGFLGERSNTNHTDSVREFYADLASDFPYSPYLFQVA